MESIKKLLTRYAPILLYLVFGVLTTLVNYLVYLPCYNLLGLSAAVSNVAAWAAAVAAAFLTNKPFVFRSYDWSAKAVLPELAKFQGTRLGSGAREAGDILGRFGKLWMLGTSVLVVVLNYVGSKLLVFRKT